ADDGVVYAEIRYAPELHAMPFGASAVYAFDQLGPHRFYANAQVGAYALAFVHHEPRGGWRVEVDNACRRRGTRRRRVVVVRSTSGFESHRHGSIL
ncbi:MAG: hypothetical protein ACKOJH_14260, partial [Actinomycetota bacterium]